MLTCACSSAKHETERQMKFIEFHGMENFDDG